MCFLLRHKDEAPKRVFGPSPFRDDTLLFFAVSRRRSPMLRSAPFESRDSTDGEAVRTAIYTISDGKRGRD